MEKPIKFINRDGLALFGMIFEPETLSFNKTIGVIISVNAIKYRLGTYRLHTILARRLCDSGYHVMYFDPAGVGDSEGYFEDKELMSHYYDIQTGKYKNDMCDAKSYFYDQYDFDSLVMLGLCGGAISTLIAAGDQIDVDGLILLGVPVLLEDMTRIGKGIDASAKITSSEKASDILWSKVKRLFKKEFWLKLVLLKVNFYEEFSLVKKSFKVLVIRYVDRIVALFNRQENVSFASPVSRNPRFNILFQKSLFSFFSQSKSVLFVFGSVDFTTWIFKSEFQEKILDNNLDFSEFCRVTIIKGANHIFSAADSQKELYSVIGEWMEEKFPLA
jgi:pimeloyl-ACP methyl ester carboxylesterase